jgi:hypothetical protein
MSVIVRRKNALPAKAPWKRTVPVVAKKAIERGPSHRIPNTLAACGDLLYQLREERLAMQAKVDAIAAHESVLKDHLINSLPKDDATGVRGKVAQVVINTKSVPTAQDWTKIQAYIRKNDAFDLLQRRLNDAAVMERIEHGKKVPGVGTYNVVSVSCTKLTVKGK